MIVEKWAGKMGEVVGRERKMILLLGFVLVIATVGALFIFPTEIVLNFENGYTTEDAPSIGELQAQIRFFANDSSRYPWYSAIFAEPADPSKSMTDSPQYGELQKFHSELYDIVIKEVDGRRFTYNDYCEDTCDINGIFLDIIGFGVYHPITTLLGNRINIGKNLFNIRKDGLDVVYSNLTALYLMAFPSETAKYQDLQTFETLVSRKVLQHNQDPNRKVNLTLHGSLGMMKEIRRGFTKFATFFAAGLIFYAIVLFVAVNAMKNSAHSWWSSCALCIAIVAFSFLAMLSAASLWALFGGTITTIMFLTPVFAFISASDMFIVFVTGWIRETQLRRDSLPEHARETFAWAYFPLAISFAVAVAFFVPQCHSIPAYQSFQIFVGATIVFSMASLVILIAPIAFLLFAIPSHIPIYAQPNLEKPNNFRKIGAIVSDWYAHLMTFRFWQIISVFMCILLIAFSCYTVPMTRGNLDYRHLLPNNSPNGHGVHLMSDVAWPQFLHVMFIIERPPDFTNAEEYGRFKNMITDLRSLEGAAKNDYDMSWYNDYLYDTSQKFEAPTLDMSKFYHFIYQTPYKAWHSGVRFVNQSGVPVITKMLYMVDYVGTKTMADKADLFQRCRSVLRNYSEFNVYTFDTEVGMTDVIMQGVNVLTSVPFYVFIIVFFLTLGLYKNLVVSALNFAMMILIYSATLGASSLLGYGVNPFSTAFFIMAIALIPRYTSYTCYGYLQIRRIRPKANPQERLHETIKNTFPPLFISVACSIVLLLPVAFAQVEIFWELVVIHVVLLNFFGLLVGTVLLPAFLCILPDRYTGTSFLSTKSDK